MAAWRGRTEGAALAKLVHDYIWDWLPNHLTPSEDTRKSYRLALELYVGWLGERGVTPSDLSASHFEAPAIEEWLTWLAGERGNSPQTCNLRLSAIGSFCRYASRGGAAFAHLEGEARSVPRRKAPKRKVAGMSEAAVRAISHAPDQSDRVGRRDVAFIVALYATACRIGEFLSMRMSQLHLDDAHPHALVIGKGGKARVAYLPDLAVEHLRAYVKEYHGSDPRPGAYVFYSRNSPAGETPLSQDAVRKMLRKHAAAAHVTCPEVPLDITPHRLRHARATHWLEQGMRIEQVSLLLGHASVQVTMDYLDITIDMEAEAIQRVAGAPEPKRWKGAGAALLAFCGLTAA